MSRGALWTARVPSTLAVLFDATIKVIRHPEVAKSAVELGLPLEMVFGMG